LKQGEGDVNGKASTRKKPQFWPHQFNRKAQKRRKKKNMTLLRPLRGRDEEREKKTVPDFLLSKERKSRKSARKPSQHQKPESE